MANHNGLIGRYPGADGMKTGFICSSGFNVVASAIFIVAMAIALGNVLWQYRSAKRAKGAT